ncbi:MULTISPECIES: sensor histidine kinase [Virgibacillus]|uniref:Sensor histidine kinase n=2 Tax=Virgibacillus TaxID=84406 RepID=A0A024QFG5_9BACI|nr:MULTISPECIES: sensor histidine kinase [Virgibacillus]EQB35135.1 hypothetical protein M948_18730 [Virgibacillus sp. CM-4]MYL42807.1 sensor histidine kinase [Virgibacillus massiliensis]GGJ69604.1 sensor histidine kinase LiaS [Virgibacillus kapii]CDQ40701.1 Sensor histidine kinase LiaS [Virgibacillus massiliensis]
MNKRFASIRYSYIRSHFQGLFLTVVTILSILLTIYVFIQPDWLSAASIFLFISLYSGIGFIVTVYAGFKSGGDIKNRLDYLSVQITQFANGNYQSRLYFNEGDEMERIANEMNDLGEKLQNQVKSLQRMADEKSDFAKSAHKAAVIEERQRLARDLHDAVSQQLFAVTMLSEAAVRQLENNPEKAKLQIQEVAKAALQSQSEMRALLLHLRPVHLSGESLSEGLTKLIKELQQKSQIDFHLTIPVDLSVSVTIEDHMFRIAQESLSNILRHSNASEVKIMIKERPGELYFHVQDNGRGFDMEQERKTSYGLKTMKERSEELGGVFAIRSNIGEGTYIDIRIPC